MSIIDFTPYKGLSDDELLNIAYQKILNLRQLSNDNKYIEYWEVAMELNEMIREIKNRGLKIDRASFINRIFV
ncbi:hypothetical protein [Caldisalinibacter kiritimatiensis]|uniref:Uncharacterized protein n=1 Tax=Caldisalinibacter kiritimatiensis TaxID=1304284 RepID=R1CS39_9FIRM|nr:hypothetical protein [Caldisalinibacter kiritimatiensis]EOC99498.1 hypothetical protein L21TH_2503 [Caldisalinibacter kiritimatiensis]